MSSYSEAIVYLYSSNVFDTVFKNVVLDLPRLILRQHLDAIGSLRFIWDIIVPIALTRDRKTISLYYNDRSWKNIWKNLSEMKGLRNLRVELSIPSLWHGIWTTAEPPILEPIMAVIIPEHFTLMLPFPSTEWEAALKGFPCQILNTPKISAAV